MRIGVYNFKIAKDIDKVILLFDLCIVILNYYYTLFNIIINFIKKIN